MTENSESNKQIIEQPQGEISEGRTCIDGQWYSANGKKLMPKPAMSNTMIYHLVKCKGKFSTVHQKYIEDCGHVYVKGTKMLDGNRDWPLMGKCRKCGRNQRIISSGNSSVIIHTYKSRGQALVAADSLNGVAVI